MITVTVAEKPCTKCGVPKPAKDFHLHPLTRTGLQSWCKACTEAAKSAQRRAEFGTPKHELVKARARLDHGLRKVARLRALVAELEAKV